MVSLLIKEAFGTGATIEEAFENAKVSLAAPEDVEIQQEVIDLPKKKTLGLFGGSPAKVRVFFTYEESPFARAEAYLRGILQGMGVEEAQIAFSTEEDTVQIQLECGANQGTVIGRRGETLDAIQYLVRLIINKDTDAYKRVSINVGSYREKREETLRELAKKQAARVRKYGRNAVLDPMNPYERRVVHTAIQEIEGVDSHSVGSDSERRVVITLAEGYTAENGSAPRSGGRGGRGGHGGGKGGYRGNGGGRGGRGGRGGSGGSKGTTQPSRPPRSDNASASLYGKIEPKAAPAAEPAPADAE